MAVRIVVNEQLHLSAFHPADRDDLVRYLNDRDIYERTLRIPYPYTAAAADEWLALAARFAAEPGLPVHWAVRDASSALIGAVGLSGPQPGAPHRAELGYWLGKPFWGRGIMTAIVRRVCRHALDDLGLSRLTAQVFSNNPASARVLVKCGFVQEGYLRSHIKKDERLIDVMAFGLVK